MNAYIQNGYTSRRDYLNQLADETGADRAAVYLLADLLGESEDFDGLVVAAEDAAAGMYPELEGAE